MNGRDLGRAWRTDDGGGPSSKHRLTVIQLFVIAWDSSSIRDARSSAPSNTIRSYPGPSVMVSEDPPPATPPHRAPSSDGAYGRGEWLRYPATV